MRGIGSIYYLAYAINHGLPAQRIETLVALRIAVVASRSSFTSMSG